MLCRLCGDYIGADDVSIGFGNGAGDEFVHGHCYTDYKRLGRAISNANDPRALKIWDKLIEVHKTLIRQVEEEQ